MSKPASKRLVCFDLGRVLVRICDNWQHAWREAGNPGEMGQLDAQARAALHDAVCRLEAGTIDIHQFSQTLADSLHRDPDQIMKMNDAFLIAPFDGSAKLIEDLAGAGITTACLSNTHGAHWQLMANPAGWKGLSLHRLSHRFASHLMQLRKPDLAIFRQVEIETGTPPELITFFDDVEENIIAARQAGWDGHRILTTEDPIGQIRRVLAANNILPS